LTISGSGTVVDDGLIQSEVNVQPGGYLMGLGTIGGNLTNFGLAKPGDSSLDNNEHYEIVHFIIQMQ